MPNATASRAASDPSSPRMTNRRGVIHVFDSPGERAAFVATHRGGIDQPITIIADDGTETEARIVGAYVKGDELWATVAMPADVDAAIGAGQPTVTVDFGPDGSIRSASIDLSDSGPDSESESDDHDCQSGPGGEPCEACKSGGTCEAESETETAATPKDGPVATKTYSPAVEAKFEKLIERYDGDPTALAYALIKANGAAVAEIEALKGGALPDGHVAVSKADADALAVYREAGKPDEVKAALAALAELGGPEKVRAELPEYRKLGAPKDLRAAIDERDETRRTLAERDRDARLREVAEVGGYDPKVFRALVTAGTIVKPGVEFVPDKVKKNGRDVDTFVARWTEADDKGQEKEVKRTLDELESSDDWRPFLASLRPGVRPHDPAVSATGYRGTVHPAAGREDVRRESPRDRDPIEQAMSMLRNEGAGV